MGALERLHSARLSRRQIRNSIRADRRQNREEYIFTVPEAALTTVLTLGTATLAFGITPELAWTSILPASAVGVLLFGKNRREYLRRLRSGAIHSSDSTAHLGELQAEPTKTVSS